MVWSWGVVLATVLATPIVNPTLIVWKSKRRLDVYSGDKRIKSYRVGLGTNPIPPKQREGDRATPEGNYRVCRKNPNSQYGMALVLNYPTTADAERGFREGLINAQSKTAIESAIRNNQCPPFNTKLGGWIEVHGRGSSKDWTWGCIALNDSDIAELFAAIPVGTPIVIKK